jgi:hypothetical protein
LREVCGSIPDVSIFCFYDLFEVGSILATVIRLGVEEVRFFGNHTVVYKIGGLH